jgi:hypothetical protein
MFGRIFARTLLRPVRPRTLRRLPARADAELTQKLVDTKHIRVIALGDSGLRHFETFVSGPSAETLDDGEAATLAAALECGGIPVIDDKKATTTFATRFPTAPIASTLDLLGHPRVIESLGQEALAQAIFLALRDARMRVFDNHVDWVVTLIGEDRAARCRSLPRKIRLSKT